MKKLKEILKFLFGMETETPAKAARVYPVTINAEREKLAAAAAKFQQSKKANAQ